MKLALVARVEFDSGFNVPFHHLAVETTWWALPRPLRQVTWAFRPTSGSATMESRQAFRPCRRTSRARGSVQSPDRWAEAGKQMKYLPSQVYRFDLTPSDGSLGYGACCPSRLNNTKEPARDTPFIEPLPDGTNFCNFAPCNH